MKKKMFSGFELVGFKDSHGFSYHFGNKNGPAGILLLFWGKNWIPVNETIPSIASSTGGSRYF